MTNLPQMKIAKWPAINPGLLRHQITIQSYSLGPKDAQGNQSRVYSGNYQTWAKIEPLTQVQDSYGQSFITDSTHRMIVRYDSTINIVPGMRITDEYGQTYNVTGAVNYEERNIFVFIFCSTVEQL